MEHLRSHRTNFHEIWSSSSSSSSVICQTTGPKLLPKWFLYIVRSRASSFNWQYSPLSLRSSSSFLRLLPRLLVTSIRLFIFPSITCRRQFLRKMWPIQLAFRFLISCMIFLCSLTLSNTSSFLTWSVQLIFSILLQHHISKLSRCFWSVAPELPSFSTIQSHAPNVAFHQFLPQIKSDLLVKRFFFLLNASFARTILDLISQVHLPSSVNMLPKYLEHFAFPSCFWSIVIVTGDGCLFFFFSKNLSSKIKIH